VDEFIKAVLTEETVPLFQGPLRWICLTVEVSCVPASSSASKRSRHQPILSQEQGETGQRRDTVAACLAA